MKRFLLAFAICSSLFLSAKVTYAGGGGGPCMVPPARRMLRYKWSQPYNAKFKCWLETYQKFNQYDSVWIKSRILVAGSQKKEAFALLKQNPLTLTIWPAKQPNQRRTKTLTQSDCQKCAISVSRIPHKCICSIRVDLRHFFGIFKPGEYRMKAEWKIRGKLANEKTSQNLTLKLPDINISIANVDFKKIAQMHEKGRKRTGKKVVVKLLQPLGTGIEYTNNQKVTLYLPYDRLIKKPGKLDTLEGNVVPHLLYQYVKTSWFNERGGWPTPARSLKCYTLASGKSVRLLARDYKQDGDGVFYYSCFSSGQKPFVTKEGKHSWAGGGDPSPCFIRKNSAKLFSKENKNK